MRGLMQDYPLTLPHIFRRAERLFPEKGVVTATAIQGGDGGPVRERVTYGEWAQRTRRLAGAFDALGISADGRVATFAWNTARHLELYFAAPCSGRVLHTLNIRLFPEQLTYIANHAEDEVVFVDRSLLGLLWPLVGSFETVKHYVVMDDGKGDVPDDPRVLRYEDLLAGSEPVEFEVDDESRAAAMCYTSGTTGNPKGVVYSHRSTVLHSMATMLADTIAVSEADVVLPVVPMFHANAWGLAHAAVFAGANLVFPGPDLSPLAIVDLIESERVTVAAGVPTIWMGVLPLLEGRDVSSLRAIPCGGSAVPKSLSEGFRAATGMPILQAWGMTETSPVASVCRVKSTFVDQPDDELADLRATQGLAVPGVDVRISAPDGGDELAWDGVTSGELQVRGPWIAATYYNDPRADESFTKDGWLRTGDVAVISPEGYIRLVDRTKDLVKSGGEWISSVELENEIMAHPKVAEAAVIGVPHERWVERPLACVVVKPDENLTKDEVLEFLAPRVAKWWLPDDVVFIDEVPKTSVGKFSKKTLRDRFADYRLPTS
ncbi:MAG: long-chain fatty acid--CoA ligase [Actinobacteria bacterium]|nr:MAG: long-chain fatty acid--CoA ligase [Actinomycetota bacterium]